MKNLIILAIFIAFFSDISKSQVIHLHSEDYNKTFSRPLIVETLEEDPHIIKHLTKVSKRNQNALNEYISFISKYNIYIKEAIEKCWKLNTEVSFKTTSQIKSLIAAKDTNYVCLYYSEAGKTFFDYASNHYLKVPTLNYSRIEHHNRKIDYVIYLPISFLRPDDAYVESDLFFAIQVMQANLVFNRDNNKNYDAATFAKDQVKNTSSLENKTLLLDEVLSKDLLTFNEIKNHYKYPYRFVKPEEINKAILNFDGQYAYMVSMPVEVYLFNDEGFDQSVICMRLLVDAKNGNILSSLGTHIRQPDENLFIDKDFEKVDKVESEK